MATLQGMINEAMKRGYTDARYGRVYLHSFTEYYRGLALRPQYDHGWNKGRKENLDKRAEDRAILRHAQRQTRFNNARRNNICL